MCVHALQTVRLSCTLLYCSVYSAVVQCLHFKPRMSKSMCKSRDDIAGITVLFKVLYYKIKSAYFLCFFNVLFVGLVNKLDL